MSLTEITLCAGVSNNAPTIERAPPVGAGKTESAPDIRLAACALLLELAQADDEFTEDERQHLESPLRRHYGLAQPPTHKLPRPPQHAPHHETHPTP